MNSELKQYQDRKDVVEYNGMIYYHPAQDDETVEVGVYSKTSWETYSDPEYVSSVYGTLLENSTKKLINKSLPQPVMDFFGFVYVDGLIAEKDEEFVLHLSDCWSSCQIKKAIDIVEKKYGLTNICYTTDEFISDKEERRYDIIDYLTKRVNNLLHHSDEVNICSKSHYHGSICSKPCYHGEYYIHTYSREEFSK